MPEALLLALPVVGGFLATTNLNRSRFRVARTSGHRLYFSVLSHSLFLTALAILVVQGVCALTAWIGAALVDGEISGEIVSSIRSDFVRTIEQNKWPIAIWAFALGYLSPVLNTDKSRAESIRIAIAGHDFERMVAESQQHKRPMLITLETGKVYLGWAVDGPNPEIQRLWVRILPWASGYRDRYQMVQFTTDYTEIIARIEQRDPQLEKDLGGIPNVRDFEVVLPIGQIVGAHLFDIKVFSAFDEDGANMFAGMKQSDATGLAEAARTADARVR